MTNNEFKKLFLEILENSAEKYAEPAAAKLLVEVVRNNAESEGITFAESALKLAEVPGYGGSGEAGGVNVWRDENGETFTKFVFSDDCTWMTLENLVNEAIDDNLFSWYEEECIRQLAD